MKAIQVSFDEQLLARLDEDPEVKKLGRSEVMRRAVAAYLRRRRSDAIRDAYVRAYGKRTKKDDELGGWAGEGAWPDRSSASSTR
ncbi:MAG TPA: ribbon-helix-helix protein, CopG family [Polyangia bacterium]|nr:ribbon-helix-helix protein, CopG family [Polyangia bacterium]